MMIELRLLGGFELLLGNGATSGRLGPKPQGLLAILAMARGQPVTRSRVAGLLWGERDEERARHSLNQALTTIRGALGPTATDLVLSDGEGLSLATDRVRLDVDEFERAVGGGGRDALEGAFHVYRGEFLEGLGIREASFEEWMLGERYRLAELAADAFASLLDLQVAEGNVDAAVATARRLVALTPLDEAAHARLIQLYGTQGRRGLAEAHYARCAELLRRELDQAPGDELTTALAEARRRSPAKAAGLPAPDERQEQPRPRSWARSSWTIPAAAAATALIVGTLAWTFHVTSTGVGQGARAYEAAPWELPVEPSIAVLPFENLSGDPDQAYFADGVTTDIITDLSKFSSLFVIAADSSFRYRDDATAPEDVARQLGVRYLLEGSVRRTEERLRINAQLIDATTGRHVWAERYERSNEHPFAAQKEIAQTIVTTVGSGWGELERAELDRIRRVPTTDMRAYDLYLLGTVHLDRRTKEDNVLAREMFGQAVQEDPNYARAMADWSITYINDIFRGWADSKEEWMQSAESLARRATEIDPSEPWALVALGLVYQLEGQTDRALPLFEKAHALNPNDYRIRGALGYAVTYAGSAERGVELLERAQRLNPYHGSEEPEYLVLAYFFAHRYQDAIAASNRITRRQRSQRSTTYWSFRAASHAELGQLDEARAAVAKALELDPDLTVESEHQRRVALGLAPAYAEHLSEALRKAGLPGGGTS